MIHEPSYPQQAVSPLASGATLSEQPHGMVQASVVNVNLQQGKEKELLGTLTNTFQDCFPPT